MFALGDGMALQADCRLGNREQFAVRRAMGGMAAQAVFHHRGMFEDHRATNRLVTAQALCALAFQNSRFVAVMGVVAAYAGHAAFLNRVMRGHVQARSDVLVAIDASRRTFVHFFGR